MDDLGSITARGAAARTLRFERRLDHAPDVVWAAITDPEQVGTWLADAQLEPGLGGSVRFDFGPGNAVSGAITVWEPPRALAYGWRFPDGHDSRVSWTLEPDGDGTLLVLVHELLRPTEATGYAAGWHAYLDRLAGSLGGAAPSFESRFAEVRPLYQGLQ
jgi:uncharacterized protein YndB with AHSA1/START domain